MHGSALSWQLGRGQAPNPAQPWPDARKGAHGLGEQVTITGDGNQLTIAATKLTDPASPADRVDVGVHQHVAQVDFAVIPGVTEGDPQLRIITLYDAAEEPVRAHVYSMEDSVERPLTPGKQTTWPVQFVVPDGFVPDHVSFRPEFGDVTTTAWALS